MIYKGVSIMSLKTKVLLPLGVMSALAAAPVLAADVPYTAVIGGTVTSVVSVGTDVHEGDVLLTVNSLAGPMAAARANSSGTVKEVKVSTGGTVAQGTVVVVVEEK